MDTLTTMNDVIEQQVTLPRQSTDHPLFLDVESAINQGDWQAAKSPLAELLTLYPDDAYLQEIAASVRTRSALLESARTAKPVPARSPIMARSMKFIIPVVIVIGLLGLAALTLISMQLWILPGLRVQGQETQISQLKQDAQAALTSGDYDRAVLAYTELLELLPDDSEAKDGLEQASQLRATISIYSEAIAEMEGHHWENALSLLEQIQAEHPGYRDVAERIAFVQQQQDLASRFNDAEAAFERGYYERAIEEYETLQSIDYGFQREIVQDHLFLSYLQLGLAQEAAAGSDPEKLQVALENLEKALTLRPDDSQAKGESQLLRWYIASLDELEAGSWSEAITNLDPVYESRPDFAEGAAAQSLYQANVAWGDELLTDGEIEQALAKYEEAHLIKDVDTSGVDQKIAAAKAMLVTPTPTPEPTEAPAVVHSAPAPTPTPRPLPYALKTMSVRNNCSGFGYIHGIVWSAYDLPLEGVTVQAINTTTGVGPLVSIPTNADGIYQIILENDQIAGLWAVQVLENGQPASPAWGQHLGGGCVNGAQELKVDWRRTLSTN